MLNKNIFRYSVKYFHTIYVRNNHDTLQTLSYLDDIISWLDLNGLKGNTPIRAAYSDLSEDLSKLDYQFADGFNFISGSICYTSIYFKNHSDYLAFVLKYDL